jgi:hypothetical protein
MARSSASAAAVARYSGTRIEAAARRRAHGAERGSRHQAAQVVPEQDVAGSHPPRQGSEGFAAHGAPTSTVTRQVIRR